MSSFKSKKPRSDSTSSSSGSSEFNSSVSSNHYKKRKHSDSSDSENQRNSKVKKGHKKNSSTKHEYEFVRPEKYKRDHRDSKEADYKRNHREHDSKQNRRNYKSASRRNTEDCEKYKSDDNRIDNKRHTDFRIERSGRNERNRERNGPGCKRRSPGRFRGSSNKRSRSKSFDHATAKWGKEEVDNSEGKHVGVKLKPNFGLSGKLTEETNTYKGVVIKYSEPPEARKPKRRWRLYPFKGEKALQTLYIHRESAYLIGRERKVVDLPVDHPSCSKQHAALQYRLVPFTREDGSAGKRVRPYLIDLESANGTFINGKNIEPKKYVELLEKDVIKFGFSSREYVLLHENSKDEAQDDDVKLEEEEVKIKKEDHIS
ncbi:smad nuclear-interacting protein 1-like [Harmonia axyridis]|uniref:smad nuclear-interacting protein 1-like n=1 Tax=Harmonia axyridis TaxID=115357 RepID=UPI001E275DF0|nr:smad nuclear-interacting protein 1-like [Harmonia axyridis]